MAKYYEVPSGAKLDFPTIQKYLSMLNYSGSYLDVTYEDSPVYFTFNFSREGHISLDTNARNYSIIQDKNYYDRMGWKLPYVHEFLRKWTNTFRTSLY